MELHRIVSAEMLPGLRLRLRFDDGYEGIALMVATVRKGGVLAAIADRPDGFAIAQNGRAIVWKDADGDDVDLCADALRQMVEQSAARAAE